LDLAFVPPPPPHLALNYFVVSPKIPLKKKPLNTKKKKKVCGSSRRISPNLIPSLIHNKPTNKNERPKRFFFHQVTAPSRSPRRSKSPKPSRNPIKQNKHQKKRKRNKKEKPTNKKSQNKKYYGNDKTSVSAVVDSSSGDLLFCVTFQVLYIPSRSA
jgi:hypothetical protein